MPELLADTAVRVLVIYSVGDRVRIDRGPLQGLSGLVAEIDGDEVLVDLRDMIGGLLVRCPANQLANR
jgi:transcription antitermination factor NusG